jgi:hypothetical protein
MALGANIKMIVYKLISSQLLRRIVKNKGRIYYDLMSVITYWNMAIEQLFFTINYFPDNFNLI